MRVINKGAAFALGVAALVYAGAASAQNNIVVQPTQPPPPAPQPAPAPPSPQSVVVSPGVTQAQPVAPAEGAYAAPAPAAAPERAIEPATRPNRALLMTGLVAFGAPYIASVGIAATSPHVGDANLWVPAIGPWLDLGQRGSCGAGTVDCGTETGNKLLLVGDGILQTFGVLEIAGAFIWPEIVPTTVGSASGPSVSFTPSKVGREGYGLSAVGQF